MGSTISRRGCDTIFFFLKIYLTIIVIYIQRDDNPCVFNNVCNDYKFRDPLNDLKVSFFLRSSFIEERKECFDKIFTK